MKLFLDAHISGRRVGEQLRQAGHDIRAADERELEGLDDPDLLELAKREGRVLVTFNVKHFVPLLVEWVLGRHMRGLSWSPIAYATSISASSLPEYERH